MCEVRFCMLCCSVAAVNSFPCVLGARVDREATRVVKGKVARSDLYLSTYCRERLLNLRDSISYSPH